MLDEITVTARIAKKLRELFDGLKADNNKQLDDAITTFQEVASAKVDERISALDDEVTGKADALTNSLNNQTVVKVNTILEQVKTYAQNKVNDFVNGFTDMANLAIDAIKSDARAQVKNVLENVKKGDKGETGEKGDVGDTGAAGVGIKKIEQPDQQTMRILTTDGKEYPITLPRGPRGSGGGGGGAGSGISTVQEFYAGVENFPTEGKAQITYFDTSKTPYEIYVWTGTEYAQAGGGGGEDYKNPTYTYTGDDLTRIDYSTGEYQVMTYNADGDVLTIDVTDSEGTTRHTFTYNIDGSLHNVTESIL